MPTDMICAARWTQWRSDMATRDELYEAVWSEPLIKLAERYKVSGNYLARVCDSLRIPRPARGYWAKKAVGKAPSKIPLPPVESGEPTEWSSGNGVLIRRSSPRRQPVRSKAPERPKTHALLQGAVAHFGHGRKTEDEGYLKPYKRHLVDLTCSQAGLPHALAFANTLFLALETKGYHVGIFGGQDDSLRRPPIDPLDGVRHKSQHSPHYGLWVPGRFTTVHVNGQMVGLSIVEIAETVVMRYVGNRYVRDADYVAPRTRSRYHVDSTWTTTMERPSGRLRLHAYAPHCRVELTKHWQETDKSTLVDCVPDIIAGIEGMAAAMAPLVEQAERQMETERLEREAEWRRYEIEEDKRQIRESEKESLEQLDSIIRHWADMQGRSGFLTQLEQVVASLPEPERASVQARIALARKLLGSLDPMPRFRKWRAPAERYAPKHLEEE